MPSSRTLLVAGVIALATLTRMSADEVLRTFENDAIGSAPSGFVFASARQAAQGVWIVRGDGTNRYLTHSADTSSSGGFALALIAAPLTERVRVSARLRLTNGDQVGGIVWGYQNPDNFYVLALDLREQELALYRVTQGNRVRLEREDDLELDREAWHTVRIVHDHERIRGYISGIAVMRARDRALQGGRAGVWSSGSSSAWFDDLRLDEPEEDKR